jgi:hypothetical protein
MMPQLFGQLMVHAYASAIVHDGIVIDMAFEFELAPTNIATAINIFKIARRAPCVIVNCILSPRLEAYAIWGTKASK